MDIHELLPYRNPPTVAVIGDICLDLYYFTGKEGAEISVETGLQSYSVFKSSQDLGGAGNVAVNCKTLGASQVDLYGIVGNDSWGMITRDLLAGYGIGAEAVLTQDLNWQTHVYHKIYCGKEELPRYDMGNQNQPLDEKVNALLDLLESRLEKYQCVIINEQVPRGLHSPYFQEKLATLVAANRDKLFWFADCRMLNDRYAHTIRKLNAREAEKLLLSAGVPQQDAGRAHFAADWLYERWGLPVILTMGEEGALVRDESLSREINSVHFSKEIDTVGAGDAFLAGLVTAKGAGLGIYEAAMIGTFSAGVSLGKLYETGHPTQEEVIALAEDCDFNYRPRLASDPGLACFAERVDAGKVEVERTDIEIIAPGFSRGKLPKIAIFDHDGTISVLRQGWEEVMHSVMAEAVRGNALLSFSQMQAIHEAVSSLIEKTTGIQTLAQMYQLKDLVLSFGHAEKVKVLDPKEYKEIYNRALLASMEKRMELVKKGKLALEDVTIKGAFQFLKKLSAMGTRLYLASGTDQEDVIREAQILGYADLFTGGIRGSVGDINNDPKKIVIRSIIAEIGQDGGSPAEAVVFGDGPVEMREAKKAGILAIGVLSSENRRWGRNEDKRKRLILGGADLLIPDFSWADELCQLCGWSFPLA